MSNFSPCLRTSHDLNTALFWNPQIEYGTDYTNKNCTTYRRPKSWDEETFHKPLDKIEEKGIDQHHKKAQRHQNKRRRQKVEDGTNNGVQKR